MRAGAVRIAFTLVIFIGDKETVGGLDPVPFSAAPKARCPALISPARAAPLESCSINWRRFIGLTP
jgi:hypothetical protein